MKQEKFEKVIEGDKRELRYACIFGILSLVFPMILILKTEITFLGLVFHAFLNGVIFLSFVNSALEYVGSRKVYWRKIK
ncbi:hypothetical protein LCGC14_1404450 [marine sediment metagenome]|uniref:Uncharacterized protein n=1 Tax=marine sediment metagenome TaxID=412755 RepID=A0A0F9MXP4_9ZZZZ